ncbi:phenylalanine--tRNA ligase subunit beta [endosymbiont of unidentified scaly snail isolate Monju]|uniref:phenylalanine--tRNA ligase subunit beta n=1 Tax=endosymbiont of unidentified scaly snail isolate Monju TaxID=1248727 RepID=UPI0003891CED|nr:phenylalanine--tRNA ligase subunit beta [endosymbiont of unidentified scaly snail isolate Monju]BAN69199.1 phenylalanyl-tRNA synthetase beta chain [endosymbiont of unidentified scaly snail isolate Monju]
MRFSEAWLREWVNPDISTAELADQLSMAGLEVDSVEPAAPAFSGVVVGHVLSCEKHPDADKLSVCRVDVDGDEPLQIVCGARNVAAGQKVPVATVGARLPGDFKIKKSKLRGVLSQGMICSAAELGLAESSDGVMVLAEDAPVGKDFRAWLDLDDACIDVDLTPDRGDCLSVAGIAREVAVLNRAPLRGEVIEPVNPDLTDTFPVTVETPEACPRYVCRVIRGIDPAAQTPLWMVERLRRSGVRAISPVVDVTNYVMLELGQPMHGFDLDRLQGGVTVRMAQDGEALTLLDGSEVTLRDDTLVIADSKGPLALAGIMGGEDSGVSGDTRNVLLEAAFFAPLAIAGKARSYGLHTDSSHRFERGVDPELPVRAMEYATALLLEIAGGQAGPVSETVSEAQLPVRRPVRLRRARIPRILGIELADAEVKDILERLGMQVRGVDEGWEVTPPGSRFDIAIEVDLIEELGRIHGYANIPASLHAAPVTIAAQPEAAFRLDRARDTLVDRDYHEVITYSFISPEMAEQVAPDIAPVRLSNPISADMSVMRASLWPGLLAAARHNLARQQERVRIFESGLTFERIAGEIAQRPRLGGLICGPVVDTQWGQAARKADFFDLKGDLEAVLTQVAPAQDFGFVAAEHPALHPGQTARVLYHGQAIGWIGAVHPQLQQRLDLPATYVFEVSLEELAEGRLPAFAPLSKYPAIRRDFAIVVARETSWDQVHEVARRAAPEIVREIQLFDVYTGENVDSDRKSLALSLILQDSSHTLTEQEVERAGQAVLEALAGELSATLRD